MADRWLVDEPRDIGGAPKKGGTTQSLLRSARFRAALVAALTGLTPAAALQGQDPPPPPPPPALNLAQIDQNPANIHVVGVQPAAVFVLRAPAKVEAGQPIAVEIVRQTHDGRAHDFLLKFDPATLIIGAPEKKAHVEDGSEGWKSDIATVENPPGDGPQTLHIYLMPGESGPQIGVPRTVDVVVTRPPMFSVRAPDAAVPRGDPIAFTIGRSGGAGQARVAYTVTQGTNLVSKGELVFEENGGPQNVGFTDYDRCGEPLTFELLGAKGQPKATAAFSDECLPEPPPQPPWVDILEQWWPVALVLPLGWLLWRGARRVIRRLFPPKIVKKFTFRIGPSSFPAGEPRLRLPQIEKNVGVTIGKAECPNPLPLRETIDE